MTQAITTVTSKYQVTIPLRVRKRLGIKGGDRVAFVETPDGFVLRRSAELLAWLAETMEDVEETVAESRRGFRPR